MKVLIVGGSGYVGSLMLPGLVDAGLNVRVLDTAAPAGDVDWVRGSATDPDALNAALDGVDGVVHAAMGRRGADGSPDVRSAFEVNVASVHMTLAAAAAANVGRGVLMSSISVFANEPVPVTDRVLDESCAADAVDTYGLTKRLAELAAEAASAAHGMTISSLRIAWPFPVKWTCRDSIAGSVAQDGTLQSHRRIRSLAAMTAVPSLAATPNHAPPLPDTDRIVHSLTARRKAFEKTTADCHAGPRAA